MYSIDRFKIAVFVLATLVCGYFCWTVYTNGGGADKILAIITGACAVATLFVNHAVVPNSDLARILLYSIAFDRPAFRTSFVNEISEEDFAKAIDQTLEALNTGVLRDRNDREVQKIELGGKRTLKKFVKEMEEVALALHKVKQHYNEGTKKNRFRSFEYEGSFFLPEVDKSFGDEMDVLKISALEKMNIVLKKAGLEPLPTVLDRDKSRPS